jgi:hypothetical protein
MKHLFQKGHKLFKGVEKGWFKKGHKKIGNAGARKGCKKSPNAYSFPIGKKHPNWKGKSSETLRIRYRIEYRLWRESVFARDNWTCQKCKEKGGILRAHHIQNFYKWKELRFAIDNGITLCEKCHRLFHHIYGIKNNTKKQIEIWLKPIIS